MLNQGNCDWTRLHIYSTPPEVVDRCGHLWWKVIRLWPLARRCRKYNASPIIATQNAQDLLSSDDGTALLANCAIAFLGGHRSIETAAMENAFGLTREQRSFLERAARGEFLLLAGNRRMEVRIELPPLHHDLATRATVT